MKLFVNGGGGSEHVAARMGLFGRRSVLIRVWAVAADDGRRTLGLW